MARFNSFLIVVLLSVACFQVEAASGLKSLRYWPRAAFLTDRARSRPELGPTQFHIQVQEEAQGVQVYYRNPQSGRTVTNPDHYIILGGTASVFAKYRQILSENFSSEFYKYREVKGNIRLMDGEGNFKYVEAMEISMQPRFEEP